MFQKRWRSPLTKFYFTTLSSRSPLPSPQQPSKQHVVRFRDLQQFIRTKSAVDDAHVRQMIIMQQYTPMRYLGKGRFGKVFLCSNNLTKENYAIKVLNVERDRKEYNWTWLTAEERLQSQNDAKKLREFLDTLSPGLVKDHMLRAEQMMLDIMKKEENPLLRRIRRPVAEREILVRIGPHPFVANLISSFRDNRFMFLVFDYFPLGNLQKLISIEKRFSEDETCYFASQLLLALEFLQNKNVAHRDVKPSNILLTREGHLALADFGLATRLRGGLKTFCGTAEYIAPEVLSEKMWSAAGLDLWAFGITLYQLLVGKTPFEAPDATSVFLNTLTAPLKFPDFLSPCAKDLLTKIINREASSRPSYQQVKQHDFFKHVNWEELLKKTVKAPDSLKPKLLKLAEEKTEENLLLTQRRQQGNHGRRFDSLIQGD